MLKKLSFLTAGILVMLFIIVFVVDKKATAADNNLYSDEVYNKYYYEQLSESSKYVYDSIYSVIDKTMTGMYEIKIDLSEYNVPVTDSTTCFQSAIDALDRDHPEVFWLDYNKIEFKYSLVNIDNVQFIRNVYFEPGEFGTYLIEPYHDKDDVLADFNDVSDYVDEILPAINAFNGINENYDKLKFIHDILVKNNEYNSDYDKASLKSHKCVSAIPGNTTGEDAPVCEGYSRAFKLLCDNANIPCVIVTGEGINSADNVAHMWDYVMLDDKWYAVDVTWDDPILINDTYDNLSNERKYKYFLKGSTDFLNSHIENPLFVTKENYDYQFLYPLIESENFEVAEENYSITIAGMNGGTITTNLKDNNLVKPGTVVKLKISADAGMEFVKGSLKINEKYYYATSFIMPDRNVIIQAKFSNITEKEGFPKNDQDNTKVTKTPAKENVTKAPATKSPKENIKVTDNPNELYEDDEDINETDDLTKEPVEKKHKFITIDDSVELEKELNEEVNDFDLDTNINVKITNHTSMERELIKVGYSHTSIDEDSIISFFNTIFDSKELEQMLSLSKYKTNYYSHIDSYSMKVSKASNGTPVTINEGEYFSVLLPLSDIYYDKEQGIDFLEINDSVLTEHDYSLISYGEKYYIYFKAENVSMSFMIVYKSESENITITKDSYVSPITDDGSDNESIENITQQNNNSLIVKLILICITVMLFILLFIIIFEIYMYYLNKI